MVSSCSACVACPSSTHLSAEIALNSNNKHWFFHLKNDSVNHSHSYSYHRYSTCHALITQSVLNSLCGGPSQLEILSAQMMTSIEGVFEFNCGKISGSNNNLQSITF